MGQGGAVEDAFVVVAPADQRHHRAVRRHHDDGGLARLALAALLGQHAVDGLVRRLLDLGREGGVHDEIGVRFLAVYAHEFLGLVGGGVEIIVARVEHAAIDDLGGMGHGVLGLGLCDRAGLHHGAQHDARAALGGGEIAARREHGRRARQRRQHRGLGQGELARRGAEIDMRRPVHAIGAGAQIDAVQIELEDLRLGQRLVERRGVEQLLELAREGALRRQEHDLGHLLGDGRAAGHHMARAHIEPGRAQEPAHVDAVIGPEASVLHRDEGGGQIGRHLFEAQPLADDRAAPAHDLAVRVHKADRDRPVGGIEVFLEIERGCEQAQDLRQEGDGGDARGERGRGARAQPDEKTAAAGEPTADGAPDALEELHAMIPSAARPWSPIFAAVSRP